jgi:hypothetical protein
LLGSVCDERHSSNALAIFIFVVWFWLLIAVFADLFRRHDVSGWIKAIWVIALIVCLLSVKRLAIS